MKIYISIPITGKDIRAQKGRAALLERMFNAQGFDTANPFRNGLPASRMREDHMRADLKMLLGCDVVFMCKGWTESKGCGLEHEVAEQCGLWVVYENQGIDRVIENLSYGIGE